MAERISRRMMRSVRRSGLLYAPPNRLPLTLVFLAGLLLVGLAGCGKTTVQGGNLMLNLRELSQTQPAVLLHFDSSEADAASQSDPNARSGANCAGGVCTIF